MQPRPSLVQLEATSPFPLSPGWGAWVQPPFRWLCRMTRCPMSFLSSRLNAPALSCSRQCPSFAALLRTCPSSSGSLLGWGAQNWAEDWRCGSTRAEHRHCWGGEGEPGLGAPGMQPVPVINPPRYMVFYTSSKPFIFLSSFPSKIK